jgi:hypothetical protein
MTVILAPAVMVGALAMKLVAMLALAVVVGAVLVILAMLLLTMVPGLAGSPRSPSQRTTKAGKWESTLSCGVDLGVFSVAFDE